MKDDAVAGDDKHREFLYKVLVIGDIGVGKTSIIKRYVHGIFSAHYKSTVRKRPDSRFDPSVLMGGVDFAWSLSPLNCSLFASLRRTHMH